MFAAVRIVGKPDAAKEVKDTLELLGLEKKNQIGFFPEEDEFQGMLEKVKDTIAYGKVDKKFAKEFCKEKGVEINGKTLVTTNPPSKGYKDTKSQFNQGGSLGYRGEEIEGLLKKM
ncbi:MAG: uL30 family ribosomal protein [Candidatus Nanohaloarchaeota archaeon QJJ-9]|nr:uL30 family ribosomal protein [Candidatus Nanohaloarchaeota archaeon QJJ-9]